MGYAQSIGLRLFDDAYQAMKNELEYYFGRELVEELDRIEKEVLIQS